MPIKKICVVTGSRAEFGYMLPLLKRLEESPLFDLDLVVTGSHLSQLYGNTVSEIRESGMNVAAEIPIIGIEDNSREGIAFQISEVIKSFTKYFASNRPDLLIAIADRYEMFGVGIAATSLLIPICHISGGSTTSGAIDEVFRHALTKMSCIHFPTCEEYRKRVIQLGESPKHVYNVGSLAIENCLNVDLLPKNELLTSLGMSPERPYCVVTYHPETLTTNDSQKEVFELIGALGENDEYQYLVTLSNSDNGGDAINCIWRKEELERSNFFVFPSLGMRRYLSALRYAEMMIGNSSSGTTEGPAMRLPVINIGDRQKGRVFSDGTLHCAALRDQISHCIKQAGSTEFKERARKAVNPFGDGSTSRRMIEIIANELADGVCSKKDFFDIDMGFANSG